MKEMKFFVDFIGFLEIFDRKRDDRASLFPKLFLRDSCLNGDD
jgi:hypothetical protein